MILEILHQKNITNTYVNNVDIYLEKKNINLEMYWLYTIQY